MIRKSSKKLFIGLLAMMLAFSVLSGCGSGSSKQSSDQSSSQSSDQSSKPADSQKPSGTPSGAADQRAALATTPVGTSMNASANGLGAVISKYSPVKVSVQPYAGASVFIPLINKGDVAFGAETATEMLWAYNGVKENGYPEKNKEIRLVARGNFLSVIAFLVRKDSPIKKVADLKGKRVVSDFPAAPMARMILEGSLYANGLTWNDVKKVPVPSIINAIDALRNGQADASFAMVPASPVMQELHSAIGVRGLPYIDNTPADQLNIPENIFKEISSRMPGVEMTTVKASGYITEDSIGIKYPNYMISSTHVSEDTVYEVLKAMWEHYQELAPIHPWLQQWNPDNFFDPNPAVPYHPGAIKLLKEKGLWNDKLEAQQKELLKLAN